MRQFLAGSITLSELRDLPHEHLYRLAELGTELYAQGDHRKARDLFEALVALQPGDAWMHLCLGLCFEQLGDDFRAICELDRSIFLDELAIQPLVVRAEILLKYGEAEMAIANLGKAVMLDPGLSDPWARRAHLLLEALRQVAASAGGAERPAGLGA